jgi:glycosidase
VRAEANQSDQWWKSGVIYQIYPRSFADSNGDGIGDLRGIIDHLDYLSWLGVVGLWLSPITVSPKADWGYDVADYCAIDPDYGSLGDFDRLLATAAENGIRLLLDFVPNHSSDQHPWFLDACSSRSAPHRDWYVWRDLRPDGAPPNNWVSGFGGSAWTLDDATGQAYLHNFGSEQPDLNWWNEEVRREFEEIQRFWFNRGVAGLRIDVCHALITDAELRDNPPAGESDHWMAQMFGQRPVYNFNRPEVHGILRRWREIADSCDPPRVLLGETVVHDAPSLAAFYGTGDDELHLALNVPFQESLFDAPALRAVVDDTERALPTAAWPLWSGSNHDISRLATRWAGGHPGKTRLALVMLLTLRGTPLLYQGDEFGLPDTALTRDDIVDPLGILLWPDHPGRDPGRTPMHWEDEPGGGFTRPGVKPWLPLGDVASCNVRAQRSDPNSILHLARDVIALRHRYPQLATGSSEPLEAPEGIWAWRRGERFTIVLNMSDHPGSLSGVRGRIAVGSARRRDGEAVNGDLALGPWEAALVDGG